MYYLYTSYTDYLYTMAMTLWYAGATYQPTNQELVDISCMIHERSRKAARLEGLVHPDDVPPVIIEPTTETYDESIPF